MIKTIWAKEEGNRGQHILLRENDLEWAMYELPATSYSAGTASTYPLADMYAGSTLYGEIEQEFGVGAATEMLVSMAAMQQQKRG